MDNQTTPTQATPAAVSAPAAPSAAPSVPAAVNSAAPATSEAPAVHHEGHEGVTYDPKMPEPQMVNGVKVFPTSYIPAKAVLHTPKKMLVEMQEWHIEGIHIAIFFAITIGLFLGVWKRPNFRR